MRIRLVSLVFALIASATMADGERPGDFDYYVLSLSWSPTWCALEGDARRSPQCDARADYGWVLHGLWPQYHNGWPSYCPTAQPQPSRQMTSEMTDIMGSPGLAWYQWKKHGSCSGLSASAYYDLARRAYDSVIRPPVFRKLDRSVTLPAKVIEDTFLQANPGLEPDMLTIICKSGRIQEARLCLSKSLLPVPCGRDVSRDCGLKDALLEPIR
ncbi:MAG: ribonuclease T2 [Thalassovita sp.]|nr:ribonuclease T2 [Thalassovita sp.]